MERKKYLGIILLVLILGIIVSNISARKTKNLVATIIDIRWQASSYTYNLNNLTFFYIVADIQIDNPNNFEINLSGELCDPNFLLDMTWKLTDNSIELKHYYGYESCGWPVTLIFRPGITNETAYTHFSVRGSNRTIMPDGEYTFWAYYTYFWITNVDSYRSILKIEKSIPTFPYFPPIKLSIRKHVYLLSIVIFTIGFHFYKKRKKHSLY
ncbi:MAG: hypothetical protein FK730_14595 [Asgard group archaeon]|nr:hypothetical protein [Asgard group archaeon]